MFKKYRFLLLFCLALAATQELSSSIYQLPEAYVIQPPQFDFCSDNDRCCDSNTIEVRGDATVQAKPDQASLSTQLTASAKTAHEAVDALSLLVNQVIKILNLNGLSEEHYSTSGFRVYPNTTWVNGVSTVNGQIATQSLLVNIPSVDGPKISKIIDDLATVNGIQLNSLSFDIKDKTVVLQKARNLAFQSAQNKAKDYCQALYLKLGKVVNLKDWYSSAPVVTDGSALEDKASAIVVDPSSSTQIQVGTVPVYYSVAVIFSLG